MDTSTEHTTRPQHSSQVDRVRRWRRTDGLPQLDGDVGTELARLSGLESLARSVIVGVVPLTALEALGSKAAVSYVFFGGALITLLFTLNVGRLEARTQRRWVLTMGVGALAVASVLFMFVSGPLLVVAIGLRSAEASVFSVCLSLYIMDFVGNQALTTTESRRILYVAGAWVAGPSIGVWMWSTVSPAAPFALSVATATATLAYFWRLRFHRHEVPLDPTAAVTHPLRNVRRYFKQSNLRIAYLITTSRAVFWAVLFVYGPLYVVEAGLPTWAVGLFLSAATGTLFLSPLVRRCADTFGTRSTIVAAFATMSASTLALALLSTSRPAGLVFWLIGAVGGAALDVLSSIPFMKMVKPHERTAMTTVFSTWRELSFLIAPLMAAGAIALGDFSMLYLVLSAILAAAGYAAHRLPVDL